jgi:hypothetical protein
VEVIAYSGSKVIYQSGVVPDGMSVANIDPKVDPDFWLLRDQMFDSQNKPVSMFWQAASIQGNEIPELTTFDAQDPAFWYTHIIQTFPRSPRNATVGIPGGQMPDRVTLRMRLQPIGLEVLSDLVDGGDLDPSAVGSMPTYDVGFLSEDGGIQSGLEWTPAALSSTGLTDQVDGITPMSCVVTNGFNAAAQATLATPPAPPSDCKDAGASNVYVGEDPGASPDADAGPVCDPQFAPDNIGPGLTKKGTATGAFTFVITSADPVPPQPRYDTWVVKILDKNGQPVTDATLTLPLPYMPLHQHTGSVVSTYASNGDGTYKITQFLFMPGNWQVTIQAKSGSTSDSVRFDFCAGG